VTDVHQEGAETIFVNTKSKHGEQLALHVLVKYPNELAWQIRLLNKRTALKAWHVHTSIPSRSPTSVTNHKIPVDVQLVGHPIVTIF